MKKFLMALTLLLAVGFGVSYAETAADSWALGFGVSYPRYYSVNIDILNSNYGGYISIQRNFTEYVGLRLKGGYYHIEGQWTDTSLNLVTEKTNLITADLDWLYYIIPCETISPYLFVGVGGNYKTIGYAQTIIADNDRLGFQLNIGGGFEAKLTPDWNLVTEFGYYVTANSALDGSIIQTELNGRDSYIALSAGVNYIFGQGKPSEKCVPCREKSAQTEKEQIEDMNEKTPPITPVADNFIIQISDDRVLLAGVNFAVGSPRLLPESNAVLAKAVKLFNSKPNVKVEIEGCTDYAGTGAANRKLALDRAESVKDYLVSKGIAANRLTTAGYGMKNPLEDSKTPEDRAMNRRIVFRILK